MPHAVKGKKGRARSSGVTERGGILWRSGMQAEAGMSLADPGEGALWWKGQQLYRT